MAIFIFDGTSVIYVSTLVALILIWVVIIGQRQIWRHRHNVARVRPQIALNSRISSKNAVTLRENQLDAVMRLRCENQARLTDCVSLQFHGEKPYVHRMIAVDEVALEIDGQLNRIEGAVQRQAGESTYSYLKRIREKVPSIPLNLVQRIAFLQEAARYRPEKFAVEQVMELRSSLNQFVKILSAEYESLADEPDMAAPRGVIASFYQFGQKIMPNNSGSKRRRNKFGGSDGVRLLMKEREEQMSLLSPLARQSADSPAPHLRRQSDSHSALLPQ
ncbi:hypothetical protein GCK72_001133 [Caenorhabditis remanei]|uniref:Uncharacterized protein n=1 Tax=Caenorhabditis remanei TaxID=31234 RepID=E3LXX1_CAERE|nr:hypothetical protein GCK72_001133 [Caenorhabditis remanei]EFO84781.1 hypothetical protein CRE_03928 [Caenorhabditis remanei]KAF1769316.1 hypothetical protein GCK72_001133 [Caenorhabditis remanei]